MYYFFAFLFCRKGTLHSYVEGDFEQNFLYLTLGCFKCWQLLISFVCWNKDLGLLLSLAPHWKHQTSWSRFFLISYHIFINRHGFVTPSVKWNHPSWCLLKLFPVVISIELSSFILLLCYIWFRRRDWIFI